MKGLLPHAEQEPSSWTTSTSMPGSPTPGKRKPADLSWWLSLLSGYEVWFTLFSSSYRSTWRLGDTGLSATYGRSPQRPVHAFPNGLPRSIDLPALLRPPLPAPRTLRSSERTTGRASRGILLSGLRETGPVTHADPRTVELITWATASSNT